MEPAPPHLVAGLFVFPAPPEAIPAEETPLTAEEAARELEAAAHVTVRRLLTHTSGLGDFLRACTPSGLTLVVLSNASLGTEDVVAAREALLPRVR